MKRRERVIAGILEARQNHQKWVNAYLKPERQAAELRDELLDPVRRRYLEKRVGDLAHHMRWVTLYEDVLEELGEGKLALDLAIQDASPFLRRFMRRRS